MNSPWYIHQLPDQTCTIVRDSQNPHPLQTWGPFADQQEALAKRVGLIRAGKCRPQAPQ
ncbi:hypothetical protein [Candidatus Cyanaurora vandensis]|uniref:hypothetical protein n=1 Tax=Candidatus Cyanaurora vandensis TaxID=2714958 RepID=UPI002579CC8A|nr:hypothetical protein [Candidatus Cyanaurora vandensis]